MTGTTNLNDPAGTAGDQYAIGINNSGTVVGSYTDADGDLQPYTESSGTFTTLLDPNADLANGGGQALGVNDSGLVVGTFTDNSGATQSFVEHGGTYVTLSDPLATSTTAEQINDSDIVVGYYLTTGSSIASGFVESHGVFTTVNDPNGTEGSSLDGINNLGQFVGTYTDGNGITHGFLDKGGSFSAIDDPAADGNGTSAFGINDEGQVIGFYLDSHGGSHGFIESAGSFTTIDDPSGTGTELNDLNDSGTIVGDYTLSSGSTSGLITSVTEVACFVSGTRILTPDGEIAVEQIKAGNEVITARAGGEDLGRVIWVGQRSIDVARHAMPEKVQPVRILAGAFGPGLPQRDLVLSPDHALFIDGYLIEAKTLVNGVTVIVDRSPRYITYHHIELERHDVVLAEGLPAESYLESGNRAMFESDAVPMVLHPDFLSLRRENACAPLLISGPVVTAVRQRLLDRALTLGFVVRDDVDLVVKAGRERIRPSETAGSHFLFVLPAGTRDVQLVSSTGVPAETSADPRDRRVLGVAVASLALIVGSARRVVRLDDDAHEGFHDTEGGHRWTKGAARIALPSFSGEAVLEVALTGQAKRWCQHPVTSRRHFPSGH